MVKKLLNLVKSRWIGCFVCLAACLLAIISMIVYAANYNALNFQYYYKETFLRILPLIGIILFLALTFASIFFKPLEKVAPAAFSICIFISFLYYILGSYKYFADVTFGGSFSLSTFSLMDGPYVFSLFAYIINLILGIAAIFLPQSKKEKANDSESVSNDGAKPVNN